MKEKPIVIGVGEFLWDMLPSGKNAGGAPVNFAYHASQNGADGWAVSTVGDDELGDELVETTGRHGINMIVSRDSHPTGTVQVSLRNGTPSYTICENVAWDYIPLTEEELEKASKASAISFGTLAQRSKVSRDTTRALVNATPAEAFRVYDINLRQNFYSKELINDSLKISNMLKINDEELFILKKTFLVEGEGDAESCRWFMEKFNLKMVILTGGDVFSSIYYGDEISTIATPKVKVASTVGAGDAFSGALIGSLLSGKSVAEAHRHAVEVAAYVCTQPGAWTPPYDNNKH